ncbi:MAG: hypothetical protein RIS70_1059 [Planctomycetota bacterium]
MQKSEKELARGSSHHEGADGGQVAHEDPRRGFLAALMATIAGVIVSCFPAVAGMTMFGTPIFSRSKSGSGAGKPYRRVANIDSLPTDGTPVQVPVVADLVDAWSSEPDQPVGAVYLRKLGDGTVQCFNAICPHAGCFVGYAQERKVFQCPCHTSSFTLEGEIIQPSPSPRAMDRLEVDEDKLKQGEVWVRYVSYLPGKHDRVEK